MTDPTDNEIAAMMHAGERGGEYLESVGKSDVALMDQEEFMTFIEAVCSGYVEKLQELNAQIEIPF